jgi:ABC-type multidrug transport system ATPase subunit
MLCGLYSPTSGNADIHGYNLRFEIEDIRSITGYCPQVDILFDSFNVKEHLQLIALVMVYYSSRFTNYWLNGIIPK